MDHQKKISPIIKTLIAVFEKGKEAKGGDKISVNPLVATVAAWYERFRNVMEYREDEVILRAAIERILKRRLLLGGSGKTVAEPLVRELVWARYFPDNSLSESTIEKIAKKIDLYLQLREHILKKHKLPENIVTQWMYQLLSATIEYIVNPKQEKEYLSNAFFHIIRDNIHIVDDNEQTRDAQVFLAVRKSFDRDDIAFLRYHLFLQYFGEVTPESVEKIAHDFEKGYKEITAQLSYPRKDRMYTYVKSKTAVFLILEDLLRIQKAELFQLAYDDDELKKVVFRICEARYHGIAAKVQRAIIRSVIFVLISKVFFAFSVEGTFESLVYGKVIWSSILLNTGIPPLLMIIVGFLIRTPGRENSARILGYLQMILFEEKPILGRALTIKKTPEKTNPVMANIFTVLWFLTFALSFGALVYVLTLLQFNIISQAIFIFFLAIVSFLTYRIGLMSATYSVDERLGWLTPIVDFFFMPVVRVGRHLTEGISQINILLFLFDFVIETPFKSLFGFFEQWFVFLRTKSEEIN